MEATGPVPPGALRPDDHPDLRDASTAAGPFASVYLTVESQEADARARLEVRVRNAAAALEEAGAPPGVAEAVGSAVLDLEPDQRDDGAVAAITSGSEVLILETLPTTLHRDLVAWSALPRLGPVIEARQSRIPHVLVLIDRAGADVLAVDGQRGDRLEVVEGDSAPIERNAPGGWSQPRYQRRAETSWEENAAEVATVVEEVAGDVAAELVIVAGDVRAVDLLQEALPGRFDDRVHVIPGSRHEDGSDDASAEEVDRLIATAAATATTGLLRKLREEIGQDDRAASGPAAVLEALAAGQVQVLLVHDDPDDERAAWFGPEPLHVGADAATLDAMGVEHPQQGRLVDVAIRAAFGARAGVRIVPRTVEDDLAAILRWPS